MNNEVVVNNTTNHEPKMMTIFEFAQSFLPTATKRANKRLPSGKMIDEEIEGVRRVYHGCAEELCQDIALAVWTYYGEEMTAAEKAADATGKRQMHGNRLTVTTPT